MLIKLFKTLSHKNLSAREYQKLFILSVIIKLTALCLILLAVLAAEDMFEWF